MIKADFKEVLNGKNDDKYVTPAALLKFWNSVKKNSLFTGDKLYTYNDFPFFRFNGTASVLASKNDAVYFRPNGDGSALGQAYIDTGGNLHLSGNLQFKANPTTGSSGILIPIAYNDYAYILGVGNASNDGFLSIATGDDGNEAIVVSQWMGAPYGSSSSIVRTMSLLDANGNTHIPQTLYVGWGASFGGDIYAPAYYATGGGAICTMSTNIKNFNIIGAASYLELSGVTGQASTAYGVSIWASDKRLKNSIAETKINALDIIKQIKHRQFKYNSSDELVKIGYVADELQEIEESLIFEVGDDKIKHPNSNMIIPVLSKAIQEQQELIEKQSNMLNLLEERIKVLEEKLNKVEDKNEILD